eukprot:CAMPEP_0195510734 /NCGR_PEP_ID=MMETSP0794_2-20130614/3296_1 /TAXON_ID=515487 /ORGANISM="Stephanopyxis turris, Strain CCMP 815" /LENGTH=393 /DNA_ID=CAMNT_0040638213 /DNA_START=620 /DNA_END=1801 /DNA_ORIENTATION=+
MALVAIAAVGTYFTLSPSLFDKTKSTSPPNSETKTTEDTDPKAGTNNPKRGNSSALDDNHNDIAQYVFNQCNNEDNTSSGSLDAKCCNGLASNCNLRVNEIMFGTVHNAMSSEEDGFTLGANNLLSLEKSLAAGFRGLMLDVCDCNKGEKEEGTNNTKALDLVLCHTYCFNGYTRDIAQVLEHVLEFLQNNSGEVVIIDFEMSSRSVEQMEGFVDIMESVPGFMDMLYDHPGVDTEWPLMGDLVSSNKRLIIFQHNGADCINSRCGPGIHMLDDYMLMTDWQFGTANDILNYKKSCEMIRVGGGGKKTNHTPFFIINHFVTASLPSETESVKVNTRQMIQDRVNACMEMHHGTDVNLFAVDFWSLSDLPMVTQLHNIEKAKTRNRQRENGQGK